MKSSYGLIVFDFDGTICDSARVKTAAFYELYREEMGDEFAAQVRKYHLAHVGVSRFAKIRHIEEVMIGRQCTDQRLHEVAGRFGRLVEDAVVAAPLIKGAASFFANRPAQLKTGVASATPREELLRIVRRRGMEGWFDAADGSPTPKSDIVSSFLRRFEVPAQAALVVGDQLSDYRAARDTGTMFLGVASDPDVTFPSGTRVLEDLTELVAVISN